MKLRARRNAWGPAGTFNQDRINGNLLYLFILCKVENDKREIIDSVHF